MNIVLTETIDLQPIIFGLIGGLGIFLYGIYIMGEALKTLAGSKMKSLIEKLTSNPFKGLLVGILVTGLLQSSSGTTALTISLIRAGLMTMPQSIGIIMGANIGTTITAFLIGLKISQFAPLFIGFGAILLFFFRHKKIKTYGLGSLGFGLLFLGMDTMGAELKILAEQDAFSNFMLRFSDSPVLAVLAGTGLTALVQSSSATTGIVQKLYSSGALELKGAIPMLLGNNIGTTITAVLAAIGGSIAAKRASTFHVLFNIFGAVLFLFLLNPYYKLIEYLSVLTQSSSEMTIAIAHIIFNLVVAFMLIWFVKQIEWLVKKIVPGEDKSSGEFNEDLFNKALIQESPLLALESSKKAILHMATIVDQMLLETYDFAKNNRAKAFEEGNQLETIINSLDRKIHEYLVTITPYVDETESKTLSKYLDIIRDLERIGDHCENLLEVFEHIHENKSSLTEDAWLDFDNMYSTIQLMFQKAIYVIKTSDKATSEELIEIEVSVDRLEKKARKRHTIRINEGSCTSEIGVVFVELLSNLERIGDHCCNIAEYTINEEYYVFIDEPEFDLSQYKPKI